MKQQLYINNLSNSYHKPCKTLQTTYKLRLQSLCSISTCTSSTVWTSSIDCTSSVCIPGACIRYAHIRTTCTLSAWWDNGKIPSSIVFMSPSSNFTSPNSDIIPPSTVSTFVIRSFSSPISLVSLYFGFLCALDRCARHILLVFLVLLLVPTFPT